MEMTENKRGLFRLFRSDQDKNLPVVQETEPDLAHRDLRLRLAEFETARVADVMIPRAEIVGVEMTTSLDELIQLYAREAHSRLPVYRDTLDDPLGVVHIRDVMAEIARMREVDTDESCQSETSQDLPLERLRRDILYVPPSMPLTDLLVRMQASRMHLALVVDEYGGTDGLVSLEDLVEEIVGDIEDEHDEDTALLVRRGRSVWEADARMGIDDFSQETSLDLDLEDHEVDSLGGVAFALAGRVPLRGEILPHPCGADIEILESDARRIHRLIVRRPAISQESQND